MLTQKNIPAVSIIIPMYNTEKYIAECLDSILAQTFKDFEVIVVDNCSTDNSAAIAESYVPKFKDRLKIIYSKVHTEGAGYTPRNIGMKIACGEYIMFVDSDDAITSTALEELYPVAKNFNADVVACRQFYEVSDNEFVLGKNKFKIASDGMAFRVKKPTLVPSGLEKRVIQYSEDRFWTAPWNYLYLRDFILKNDIKFPEARMTQDAIFVFFALCLAKVVVTVPNLIYIYRQNNNSTVRKKLTAEEMIHNRGSSIFKGILTLDKFMNRFELFQQKPELKYRVFSYYSNYSLQQLTSIYMQVPASQLDIFVRQELEKIENTTPLTAYLFSLINVFNINLLQQQNVFRQKDERIQQLQVQLQQSDESFKEQQQIIQQLQVQLQQSVEFLKKQQQIIQQLESALQQK